MWCDHAHWFKNLPRLILGDSHTKADIFFVSYCFYNPSTGESSKSIDQFQWGLLQEVALQIIHTINYEKNDYGQLETHFVWLHQIYTHIPIVGLSVFPHHPHWKSLRQALHVVCTEQSGHGFFLSIKHKWMKNCKNTLYQIEINRLFKVTFKYLTYSFHRILNICNSPQVIRLNRTVCYCHWC